MPARTRASRGKDSKLTESTPWLYPAGGYVEPSRTLSPTSTRIGSPMLPIIEKHGPGPDSSGMTDGHYTTSRPMTRAPVLAFTGLRNPPEVLLEGGWGPRGAGGHWPPAPLYHLPPHC